MPEIPARKSFGKRIVDWGLTRLLRLAVTDGPEEANFDPGTGLCNYHIVTDIGSGKQYRVIYTYVTEVDGTVTVSKSTREEI